MKADMTDLDVRPVASEDLAALQAVRAAAFAPIFRAFHTLVAPSVAEVAFAAADAEQAALLARLAEASSASELYVARRGGAIVGFVPVALDRRRKVGEIGLLGVAPDAAGRGVGTALVDVALARMRAAGMRVAEVSTGADPSHAPARRLYEKAGFGSAIPAVTLFKAL